MPGPHDPDRPGTVMLAPGHAAWAYNQEAASKLWDLSLQMVGLAA